MQKKKFLKVFVALLFVIGLSMTTYFFVDKTLEKNKFLKATAAEDSFVTVSSFQELKEKTEQGTKKIKISANIDFTDTIYVSDDTTIFVDNNFTITRNANFLEDMFIVGEDKDGNNPILKTGLASKLTMITENGAKLIIDGNKEKTTGVVVGSVVMTVNTAEFNMYEGVVLQNHKKMGNKETLNHRVSYPEEVGGAAVIVASGSFNMYGGEILNCQVNEDEETTTNSTKGGAVYSFGQVNMYGGKIESCRAARGGAIFNYRLTKVFAGQILNNFASVYGGAIYNPNSQYSNLTVGDYADATKVLIKGNSTSGSGGAIFSSISSSLFIPGATEFVENTAESNGGAINSPGANVIKNTVFKANEAGSKGGAIYVYHNKANATVRHTVLDNVDFVENKAVSGGGALGSGSSVSDGSYPGSTVYAKNCNFDKNEAEQGGAIYIIRLCTVELKNCQITNSKATDNGGGIYVTGASNLTIDECVILNNTAVGNGGGIYSTTDAKSKILNTNILNNKGKGGGGVFATANSSFDMENALIRGNEATNGNGGGLYIYTTVVAKIKNTQINSNQSTKYGGAIYVSGKANLELESLEAKNNVAQEGGFLYLTTGGTVVKIVSGRALDNIAEESKGSTIWTNSASVVLQIKGTTSKQFFNYNGEILGKGEVEEYET